MASNASLEELANLYKEITALKEKVRRKLLLRIAEDTIKRRDDKTLYNTRKEDVDKFGINLRDIQYSVQIYEILGEKALLNNDIPFSALKVIAGFNSPEIRGYLVEHFKENAWSVSQLSRLKDCKSLAEIKGIIKN